MSDPTDPITALAQASAQLHELFESYVTAGFTEHQALELLKALLTAGIGGSQG
ncbi:hypothetical protein [Streptomyces sp. NPDC019937]|uniref:hypothetical protein n=1 Tax=Streptomyces sp. NPDC019937 TaxID=3154787 RepID=UPI0033E6325D